MKPTLNTIPASITGIKQGEVVVVVDNEDRENEGNFVTATCNATFGATNFVSIQGRRTRFDWCIAYGTILAPQVKNTGVVNPRLLLVGLTKTTVFTPHPER